MALLRPLSGSGSFAIMSETLTAYGPDSFVGYLSSTLMGSTETTFYVLAIYYGAARITQGNPISASTRPTCSAGPRSLFSRGPPGSP